MANVAYSRASHVRLSPRDLPRFPDTTLFHAVARAVCQAGVLPRKELFEAWEIARRTRRLFRGGRVVDLAGGHGLLAHLMLILDDQSPAALVVDTVPPPSGARVQAALLEAWPRLAGRVQVLAADLRTVPLGPDDVVVASHACGGLTDLVLDRAVDARARVAVLPCCHDLDHERPQPLGGWLDGALEMDVLRAVRLRARGYRVWTQQIPADITPMNRLLIGAPAVTD